MKLKNVLKKKIGIEKRVLSLILSFFFLGYTVVKSMIGIYSSVDLTQDLIYYFKGYALNEIDCMSMTLGDLMFVFFGLSFLLHFILSSDFHAKANNNIIDKDMEL